MENTEGREGHLVDDQRLIEGTKCPVCIDFLVKPKQLIACSHVLCLECLRRYYTIKKKNYPPCPVCRTPIRKRLKDIDTLPDALFHRDFLEVKDELERQRQKPPPCFFCEKEKPLIDACLVCNNKMCQDCSLAHKKLKSSHITKPIEELEALNISSILPLGETECNKHPGTLKVLYCLLCKTTMCVTCNVTGHNQQCRATGESLGMAYFKSSPLMSFLYENLCKGKELVQKVTEIRSVADALKCCFERMLNEMERYGADVKRAVDDVDELVSSCSVHWEDKQDQGREERQHRLWQQMIKKRILRVKEGIEAKKAECEGLVNSTLMLLTHGTDVDVLERGLSLYDQWSVIQQRWMDNGEYVGKISFDVVSEGLFGLSCDLVRQRHTCTLFDIITKGVMDLHVCYNRTKERTSPVLITRNRRNMLQQNLPFQEWHLKKRGDEFQMYNKKWMTPCQTYLLQAPGMWVKKTQERFTAVWSVAPNIKQGANGGQGKAKISGVHGDGKTPCTLVPSCKHQHVIIVLMAGGYVGFFCPKLLGKIELQFEGEEFQFEYPDGEQVGLWCHAEAKEPLSRMLTAEGTCDILPEYRLIPRKGVGVRPVCMYDGYKIFYRTTPQKLQGRGDVRLPVTADNLRIAPGTTVPRPVLEKIAASLNESIANTNPTTQPVVSKLLPGQTKITKEMLSTLLADPPKQPNKGIRVFPAGFDLLKSGAYEEKQRREFNIHKQAEEKNEDKVPVVLEASLAQGPVGDDSRDECVKTQSEEIELDKDKDKKCFESSKTEFTTRSELEHGDTGKFESNIEVIYERKRRPTKQEIKSDKSLKESKTKAVPDVDKPEKLQTCAPQPVEAEGMSDVGQPCSVRENVLKPPSDNVDQVARNLGSMGIAKGDAIPVGRKMIQKSPRTEESLVRIRTKEVVRKRALMKQMEDKSIITVGIESPERIMCMKITADNKCRLLQVLEQSDIPCFPIQDVRPIAVHLDKNTDLYVFLAVVSCMDSLVVFMPEKERKGNIEILKIDVPEDCGEAYVTQLSVGQDGHVLLVLQDCFGSSWFATTNYWMP